MNGVRTIIPFILMIMLGCGGKPSATRDDPQVPGPVNYNDEPTHELIEETYFCSVPLQLSSDSNRCIISRSESERNRLQRVLLSYSQQPRWPFSLLETQYFTRRYALSVDEKKCIKEQFCSKGIL